MSDIERSFNSLRKLVSVNFALTTTIVCLFTGNGFRLCIVTYISCIITGNTPTLSLGSSLSKLNPRLPRSVPLLERLPTSRQHLLNRFQFGNRRDINLTGRT